MKQFEKAHIAAFAGALMLSVPAFAQTSVTLYGVIDNSITYQNSQTALGSTANGRSIFKMTNGANTGSRFGLKGSEELGGGNYAIFQLESGFNSATGAQQYTNAMFGRQAWVGLKNNQFGTLTFGRQYTSYYQLLSPWSPTQYLTGFSGAHPGDLDALDTTVRVNNSIVYTSPKMYGFTFSGNYAMGGVPGSFNAGSTWSTAVQYVAGPVGVGVGFMKLNNATPGGGAFGANSTANTNGEQAVSAVTNGYQTAQSQQRFAVAAGYTFSPAWDMSATYSNVQYAPGTNSLFRDEAVFNTVGAVLHYRPAPQWSFGAGYSYTWASRANGINDAAKYQQVSAQQTYSLSPRTTIYVLQAWQRASGKTLGTAGSSSIINATPSIGDGFNSAPSSSATQIQVTLGLVHKF
ncbi:porin [Robbsia sp. KACC 23696]|uniref:porin n=1 Tax=Robbsia sp. KACC 23696 TaxID=3149231 RepID=UPI00325B8C74